MFPDEIEAVVQNDLQISVTDTTDIDIIRELAIRYSHFVKVHLNIDTGMGRVEIPFDKARSTIIKFVNIDQIKLEGI